MKRIGVLLLLAVLMPGCAVLNKDNRYLSRVVGGTMWPESTLARVAAAPVVGPVWLVALVADALVVNPVLKAPKAFGMAMCVFTVIPPMGPAEIVVWPARVLAFPLVFVGTELLYCMNPL